MATANAVGVGSSESPAVRMENGPNPSPVWTSVQVGTGPGPLESIFGIVFQHVSNKISWVMWGEGILEL